MTDFVDEARSRTTRLLRMASAEDVATRIRVREYAERTPEPPLMGRDGIHTTGCPQCRSTMWRHRDNGALLWICASCGHVAEDAVP